MLRPWERKPENEQNLPQRSRPSALPVGQAARGYNTLKAAPEHAAKAAPQVHAELVRCEADRIYNHKCQGDLHLLLSVSLGKNTAWSTRRTFRWQPQSTECPAKSSIHANALAWTLPTLREHINGFIIPYKPQTSERQAVNFSRRMATNPSNANNLSKNVSVALAALHDITGIYQSMA